MEGRTMKAVILVDVQNDFLPGGALAVPDGEAVIEPCNRLAAAAELVVATQDWHPAGHGSFASQHPGRIVGERIDLDGVKQTLWPDHCVQGTHGAELAAELDAGRIARVFPKGTERLVDSYSGFQDAARRGSTGLAEYLRERGVDEVFVAGLATDFCVRATAADALAEGLVVNVVTDACRGVNLNGDDAERALEGLRAAGARLIETSEAIGRLRKGR
jgi:nicotinamidase/pyrazinamidase